MKSGEPDERSALLERLLRKPLEVTKVGRGQFQSGPGAVDEIITTCRFILILKGALDYTIEGRTWHLGAGTQFFVPAWVKRVWSVPRTSSCEIIWCEFDDDPMEVDRRFCYRRVLGRRLIGREKERYVDLGRKFSKSGDTLSLLAAEGVLKAMLADFWQEAEAVKTMARFGKGRRPARVHPHVRWALRWMEREFMREDAVAAFYEECPVTPNYFRKQFKDAMQCSPQAYLQRLKLRHARYLLYSTDWQLKRVAVEVGYQDPLYFSRLYHRFWKHSPSGERAQAVS